MQMNKPPDKLKGHLKPRIYWHRELPPLNAQPMGEHVLEASSERVPHMLVRSDELWDRCYESLMKEARKRLEQEIVRLGGACAHVLDESVESKHDGKTGEGWLHGQFTYMLYGNSHEPEHS
jgi:hypothetical protein